MNTGIQDGYNLAWKLASVLKGGADTKLLETYNEERLPNAHRLLQTTDRFFALAASDEPVTVFFRQHIFPHIANFALNIDAVKRFVFPLISQIGVNYRGSSLSVGNHFKVKAGDRMPYFEIDGENIYDRLRESKFHLLIFSDGSERLNAEQTNENSTVDVFPLYPSVAETFGASRTFSILLRPDNYIGYIGTGSDPAAINDYFSRFMTKRVSVSE